MAAACKPEAKILLTGAMGLFILCCDDLQLKVPFFRTLPIKQKDQIILRVYIYSLYVQFGLPEDLKAVSMTTIILNIQVRYSVT